MEVSNYKKIIEDIEQSKSVPLYWLEGEEHFFIDQIVAALRRHIVPKSARDFNQWIIYGKEIALESLLTQAKQYPIGHNRQLYIIRQPQQMIGWQQKEVLARLSDYIQNPPPFTVLAFCISLSPKGSFLPNRPIRKLLKEHSTYFQSKKLYDNQIPGWLSQHVASKGYHLGQKGISMLLEGVGADLQGLSLEIDKLSVNLSPGDTIEERHITTQVGVSKEYNLFELQKALGAHQSQKAYCIMDYLIQAARMPAVSIVNFLFQYFFRLAQLQVQSKTASEAQLAAYLGIHPYFLKEYKSALQHYRLSKVWRNIELMQTADARLKGLQGYQPNPSGLLKELLYRLMR